MSANYSLSARIESMEESATLAMAKKARELKAEGKDIISLSLGEPDFQTPDHIRQAAKDAIDSGKYFSYPPVAGYNELREAIATKLKEENGIPSSPEQIVVSAGAKHSIANVFFSILNPGDEVVVFSPYWVSYAEIIKLAEGTPVYIKGKLENDFKATAEDLAAAITPKTKAIIYSSPSNPTGGVFTLEELESIAAVLKNHPDILVVADEIYELINFSGKHYSMAAIEGMADRTITVNGFSKGFAMTGWRVGYISAPVRIAKACEKMQGQFTSGVNGIAQQASITAIKGDKKASEEMAAAYKSRRKLVLDLLNQIEGIKTYEPKGAFYIFPDVSSFFGKAFKGKTISNANDLSLLLLEEAQVSVVTGAAFGDEDCIRISFAASDEQLKIALGRIKEVLDQLK
ncbi:MAG: pyridoxal phosphate-dependent aminotransferase [Cyclobacteriaceae bacterium]|nr:pyridoxal phosphate-dependent aminotransferase [Cyclobacteriaceae bacterium]MCH8515217.1 pyridoxal phosphate-dependent aminotransferase [Cyclobacteriaceae bacterium]